VTASTRFVCSDPDAGDFEFADVEAVLDALEAALVQASTPLFDTVRQSWQPVGLHPEIRAAWEARLRFRPPTPTGLSLPALPSMTELVRSLPVQREERVPETAMARVRSVVAGGVGAPRFAAFGLVWALVLLALVGWAVIVFAARLAEFAAGAVGVTGRK
jgi:hypothetical protein